MDYWLSSALAEGIEDQSIQGILRMCCELVEVTKELPSCLDGFLKEYLKTWDGETNRDAIFKLLVSVVPTDFERTTSFAMT